MCDFLFNTELEFSSMFFIWIIYYVHTYFHLINLGPFMHKTIIFGMKNNYVRTTKAMIFFFITYIYSSTTRTLKKTALNNSASIMPMRLCSFISISTSSSLSSKSMQRRGLNGNPSTTRIINLFWISLPKNRSAFSHC